MENRNASLAAAPMRGAGAGALLALAGPVIAHAMGQMMAQVGRMCG
ncbi:MAG: hypothetical protein ACRDRY_18445 [Pseudonocardiaceae bacterium]